MLKDYTQMTRDQLMNAYDETSERFALNWMQRDQLDISPMYHQIMFAAHNQQWETVQVLLVSAGIV